MTTWTLQLRGLLFHRRMHLATLAGVIAGSAALAGALIVGDSMRGSLQDQALSRLGPVDFALVGPRLVEESLAARLAKKEPRFEVCPILQMQASITHADTQSRAHRINLVGADDRFWRWDSATSRPAVNSESPSIILNSTLATEIGAKAGNDVIVRLESRGSVPTETLLGRRDETAVSMRLTVARVIPDEGLGGYSLEMSQRKPRDAFMPLVTLQRAMKQPDRINTLLFAANPDAAGRDPTDALAKCVGLPDYELALRTSNLGYVSLESRKLLLEPPVEEAALAAARQIGATPSRILTYLANEIADESGSRTIPYSVVSAIESELPLATGSPKGQLGPRDILLNEWSADDLGAKVGDKIRLKYFVSRPMGRLETAETTFTLRGIVKMTGLGADRGFAPTYEGITNASRLSDWKPPFPFDLKKIRPKDEKYWDQHQATPKAFVSLAAGLELWAESGGRFGRLTSIQVTPANGKSPLQTADEWSTSILKKLRPDQMGLAIRDVRREALEAGQGSTDFGMLFISFSFFLIVAAAMLVALMFRLGVERRAGEVGILLATGFRVRKVSRLLLGEGALLAAVGVAVGLAASIGYAWLMLAGLRSWWASAVNAPFLRLYASPTSLAVGFASSFIVCLVAIAWAVRGMSKKSPRSLLAGALESGRSPTSPRRRQIVRRLTLVCVFAAIVLVVLPKLTPSMSLVGAFFGGGSSLLMAFLMALWLWLTREPTSRDDGTGFTKLALAARSAGRRPSRSLLAAGLVASASFVIVAVGASRRAPDESESTKKGGTGGFSLIAESVVPLPYNLGRPDGRSSLGLTDATNRELSNSTVVAFRAASGDDTSCLNLYKARQPRILGATPTMIERGGFAFSSTLAESPEEKSNPWQLLDRTFKDGAIPAIGDENAVRWLLHVDLGGDLVVQDERGQDVHLRIVGMLAGSILQGELVVAETGFLNMFPSATGYPFLLIETPKGTADSLAKSLEHDLSRYGLDAESTTQRLASYLAVENTYMSTFQTLGGLGLLLGTLGLAAVAVRNMFERRGELALLRALGYRVSSLFWMALAEHATVLVAGLLIGTISALVAVAPNLRASPSLAPWESLGAILVAVLAVGLATGAAALAPVLRAPLIPALRTE